MISIIVPCFNQHDATYDCLTAVLENTQDCEIIVIDNGSTPPIKPPFSGFIETRVIRNEANLGFPVAVNQGIKEAKGDTIILLNNDVIVTPGWAERLLYHLDTHHADLCIGGGKGPCNCDAVPFSIIGPVTNYAAGLQRVQIGSYENQEDLNKEAAFNAEECARESEEVNWIIGFCMAFKKSLWEAIGSFDESLWPCSGEEIDFCLRARAAGHRVGIAHDVYVHHEGSKTFKDMMPETEYEALCKRNDAHLAEKWGKAWIHQEINGGSVKPESVTWGAHSYVDGDLDISFTEDGATLTIGKFCSIAQGCKVILGGNHRGDWISTFPFPAAFPDSPDIPDYRTTKGNVVIGNDVWIGTGVTILSGVTIGDGAIVGAGSVVVKDVAPYSVAAGNPAEWKKNRFTESTTNALLDIKWWNWPDETIRGAIPLLMSGDMGKLLECAAGAEA